MRSLFIDPQAGRSLVPDLDELTYWLRRPGEEQWLTTAAAGENLLRYRMDLDYSVNLSPALATATAYCLPPTVVQSATLTLDSPSLQIIKCYDLRVGLLGTGEAGSSGAASIGSSLNYQASVSGSFDVGPGASRISVYCANFSSSFVRLSPGSTSSSGSVMDIIATGAAPGTTISITQLSIDLNDAGAGGGFYVRDSVNVTGVEIGNVVFTNSRGFGSEASLHFTGLGLTQTAVDDLCDKITSGAGVAGRPDLSGGTSAVPSGNRLADLAMAGWTVTTN